MLKWGNGRPSRLKIYRGKPHESSSLSLSTKPRGTPRSRAGRQFGEEVPDITAEGRSLTGRPHFRGCNRKQAGAGEQGDDGRVAGATSQVGVGSSPTQSDVAIEQNPGYGSAPYTSCGSVPERSMGADCKSAGVSLRWFKSIPVHHFINVTRAIGQVAQGAAFTSQRPKVRILHRPPRRPTSSGRGLDS